MIPRKYLDENVLIRKLHLMLEFVDFIETMCRKVTGHERVAPQNGMLMKVLLG